MLDVNVGYGAIQNVRGDVVSALVLETVDIPITKKTVLLSLYTESEGGTTVSLVINIRRKGDLTVYSRIVRYNPVIGQDFSYEIPLMNYAFDFGESASISVAMTDSTRILGYLNYCVVPN